MAYKDRDLLQVRNALLYMSGMAWVALLLWPGPSVHCAVMSAGSTAWRESLQMNRLVALTAGWFLMLVAMMAPMLILPVYHIQMQSFKHRRRRSIGLFVAGYFGIWVAAGLGLILTELHAEPVVPSVYVPVAAVVVAVIWQFSPIKQYCLNRGHLHPPLMAFGRAADRAAFRFGVGHGIWCFGSCWALMILPMLFSRGHVAAMAAVSFLTFSERLERPASPCWGWRLSGKLMRILIAQMRMRLRANGPTLAGLNR